MKKLQQNWWHIHDKPVLSSRLSNKDPFRSRSRQVRQVMDIITTEETLQAPLNQNFVRLKVRNKHSGNELSFIGEEDKICINLGNLEENWPLYYKRSKEDDLKLYQIKIEFEFELINQPFKPSKKDFLKRFCFYKTAFSIGQLIQPEFYITVPKGTKLNKNTSTLSFMIDFKNSSSLKFLTNEIGLEKIGNINIEKNGIKTCKFAYNIKFDGPSIDLDEKTRRYSYLVDFEDYKKLKKIDELLERYSEENSYDEEIYFGYEVQFDKTMLIILILINYVLLFVATLRILSNPIQSSSNIGISFLLIMLSLITLRIKLYEDGYFFPVNLLTYLTIITLALAAGIELIR